MTCCFRGGRVPHMRSDLSHHVVGSQLAHLNVFVLRRRWLLQTHALLVCTQCCHSGQWLGAFGNKVSWVLLNPVCSTRVLRHRLQRDARCVHLQVARRSGRA